LVSATLWPDRIIGYAFRFGKRCLQSSFRLGHYIGPAYDWSSLPVWYTLFKKTTREADMKAKKVIGISLVAILLCLLYFQTFIWLVNSWLSHSYYSHGFLIPLLSGFIFWRKRHQLKQAKPFPPGILVIALGLLLYVAGLLSYFNFLSAISFLVVLGGLVLYFWGSKGLQSLLFPICFLIFMIPLPFLDSIGNWLQSLSAHWSAAIIGAMGIPVAIT